METNQFSIRNDDDSIALAFDYTAAVAFDAIIMKREGAEKDYTDEQIEVGSVSITKPHEIFYCVKQSSVKKEDIRLRDFASRLTQTWRK